VLDIVKEILKMICSVVFEASQVEVPLDSAPPFASLPFCKYFESRTWNYGN